MKAEIRLKLMLEIITQYPLAHHFPYLFQAPVSHLIDFVPVEDDLS